MSESKPCSCCKQIKPVVEFYKRAASRDGLSASCITCSKDAKRNSSESTKAKNLARAYAWAMANPERTQVNKKTSADRLRPIRNERNRAKYQANPEPFRLKKRNLRNSNKPLYDSHGINRRAIKRGSKGFAVTAKEISAIRNSPCFYCGQEGFNELDHVIPLSRGGAHSYGNLVSACRSCNASKGNKFITEWRR